MLRIVNINKKSEVILKDIAKNISTFSKLNKQFDKNKPEIQKLISKIHFKLNEYEYIQNLKPEEKKKKEKNPIVFQRKLQIKKKDKVKQSKSFFRWLINNKEI
jgi:hypothetical protein